MVLGPVKDSITMNPYLYVVKGERVLERLVEITQ